MNLFFCGDIMPGGVLPYQSDYISSELCIFLKQFDYRIGTLEAAIGTNLSYDPIKMAGRQNIIYARDVDLLKVKEMGFDVVSLANNHVFDLGEEGLNNTIRLLCEYGIQYCGAGPNSSVSSRPVVLEKDECRIAIFSYCMYGSVYLGHVELARKDQAGINPLDIENVVEDIKKAKRVYNRVIVLPHWGREYHFDPLPSCINMAKMMIDAGADAVLGSHPHQIQPMLWYKKRPICFSMGNFLFPDFYMYPPRPIWYPDKEMDLSGIKDVVGYPFPIQEPIRHIWNPISRYGCVITMEINAKTLDAKVRYVHCSDKNVISLSDIPSEIKKELGISRLFIKSRTLRIVRRLVSNIRKYEKRLIGGIKK